MTIYRVNFGNGQVTNSFNSRQSAINYMKAQREYDRDRSYGQSSNGMFLQKYEGDGEWSTVNLKLDALSG